MTEQISVVVADDQTLLRSSFTVLIDAEDDMKVIGEAGSGRQAVEAATLLRPDVVIMDVRMPDWDGIDATGHICGDSTLADTRVLMLTTFDLDEYVYASMRAGASGFLLKDTPPAQLLHAIRVVAEGDALLAPTVTSRLIGEFVRRPLEPSVSSSRTDSITDREREVLILVAKGLSNQEISQHLYLGMATVKTHVSHLLTKLGVRDRAQLVIVAYETGLVQPRG